MIDSDRLRQALAAALESGEPIPAARNGRTTIDGVEYTAVPVAELEELRAMKERALDAERWTRGAGAVEKSVGQREGVRYVLYGEVPVQL